MAVTRAQRQAAAKRFMITTARSWANCQQKCIFQLCELFCAMCMCATHLMVCAHRSVYTSSLVPSGCCCCTNDACAMDCSLCFAVTPAAGVEHHAYLESFVRAGSSSLMRENTEEPINTKMNSPTRKEPCCGKENTDSFAVEHEYWAAHFTYINSK
jgi:hypothetical protein